MTLLAALFVGAACSSAAGLVMGSMPEISFRRHRVRKDVRSGELWLRQAGVALSPRQFWVGSIGVGVLTFVAAGAIVGAPAVALAPAIAVAMLPRAYFGRQRAARLHVVAQAWPDGLRDVLASVSSGSGVGQAVSILAATGPQPLREAFERFPNLARMLGTVAALEIVKAELAEPTSDRVIEVLIVAHERGGAIVREILEGLIEATTRDLKLREEIDAEGLEMKINARAVLVIPWLMLFALTLTTPAFRDFYTTSLGGVVVFIGAILSALGTWMLARLAREQGEQRVFVEAAESRVAEMGSVR